MVLRTAWVAEDAYITFRTLDNFVNGYGLRWNIAERVQAYTNPLWLFLHAPFYVLWPNIDLVTMGVSFACTVGAVLLALYALNPPPERALAFLLLPMLFSKTLSNYSFSGLENPLSHLLIAWFTWVLWRNESPKWFWLSLAVALSMVNRLDMLIIYVPVLVHLAFRHQRAIPWKPVLLGMLPIIAWLSFSFFYYGFLFPNTKYAKLNTGVDLSFYLSSGWRYMLNFIVLDTMMAVAILLAFLLPAQQLLNPPTTAEAQHKDQLLFFLALGMAGYCLYIFLVGGTFISCRYMSIPVFMAVWILLAYMENRKLQPNLHRILCAMCGIALIASGLPASSSSEQDAKRYGVLNFGYGNFYGSAYDDDLRTPISLLSYHRNDILPARRAPPQVRFAVGKNGYFANPHTYIIDFYGLANALLARLPAKHMKLIGHGNRDIPEGYLYAVRTGDLSKMNPSLARYYNKLLLITTGDLWSLERLKTILLFNLGIYDKWRKHYIRTIPPGKLAQHNAA